MSQSHQLAFLDARMIALCLPSKCDKVVCEQIGQWVARPELRGIDMIQLSYVSVASCPMDTEQLLNILSSCLSYNTSHSITGLLLYGNGIFLQALEGEEDLVLSLYSKIEKDERHRDVKLLHNKKILERRYSEWSMGFQRLSDDDLKAIDGLRDSETNSFNEQFASHGMETCKFVLENYATWNPLLSEVDETNRLVYHLQNSLKRAISGIDIARLVLESVIDAHGTHGFNDDNQRLCAFALSQLNRI